MEIPQAVTHLHAIRQREAEAPETDRRSLNWQPVAIGTFFFSAVVAAAWIFSHRPEASSLNDRVISLLRDERCEEALNEALGFEPDSDRDLALQKIAVFRSCIENRPEIVGLAVEAMRAGSMKTVTLSQLAKHEAEVQSLKARS